LSYKVHHDRLNPTITVTHSLHKQGLFSLISFYSRVYVTANASNYASFCSLLRYFGYSDEEQRFHQNNFKNCKDSLGTHWFFDTEKREISKVKYNFVPPPLHRKTATGRRKTKETSAEASARETLTMAKADRYFSAFEHHKEAKILFEILYQSLKKSTVNPATLDCTLAVGTADGPPKTISLVEYIGSLVDAKQKDPISRDSWQFHRYALGQKGVKFPRQLILNKEFL